MKEKSYRSILKSVSWRTIGTLDTFLISLVVTGKLDFALTIGGIEVFTKMALYYFHERTWNRINLGKVKSPDVDFQI